MALMTQAPAGRDLTDRALAAADRLHRPMPQDRLRGWLWPLAVTLFAALLRWPALGRPHAFAFDETYYAKDAFSLLRFGYERGFVEKANDLILASDGDVTGLDEVFKDSAAYVVHPPLGKWVIAVGEQFFGMTPFGWRFSVAVLGTLLVLVTARLVRRLTRSTLIGTIAGFLVALDGMAIVMSRTAILDGILAFFLTCAFAAIVLDRDMVRARFAARLRQDPALMTQWATRWGPPSGPRPWLFAAGLLLGAALSVKWSALWFIAFLGLLVFAWGTGTRRLIGTSEPIASAAWRDGIPALVPIVMLPLLAYAATWWGWFASDDAWFRDWAASNPGGMTWLPSAVRSWLHYHSEAWAFHVNLTSDHSYEANAWNWPVMGRPTSFFYEDPTGCGADKCSQEVIALGNPLIWWAGALALLHQAWRWLAVRDWRSGAIVAGWLAGWFPWLLFQERTIFAFYAVVLVPFLAGALAMSLGSILGAADAHATRRRNGAIAVGGFLMLALAITWFFLPIWVAELITYDQWRMRMWLPTWI